MSDGLGSFDGNRIKHMEMIQAVVARLAGNSFLIKGWALTLTGVFLGFALNKNDRGLAAAALLPILAFWALDTYYLRSERLFRALYDRVRSNVDAVDPFSWAPQAIRSSMQSQPISRRGTRLFVD